jgi:hypothetical protein
MVNIDSNPQYLATDLSGILSSKQLNSAYFVMQCCAMMQELSINKVQAWHIITAYIQEEIAYINLLPIYCHKT